MGNARVAPACIDIEPVRWLCFSSSNPDASRMQNLDRFGKMGVSAFVMAGGAVVMLLYGEGRFSDDHVRHFLFDVGEIYMKVHLLDCVDFNVHR